MEPRKCKRCGEIFQPVNKRNSSCQPCIIITKAKEVKKSRFCLYCGKKLSKYNKFFSTCSIPCQISWNTIFHRILESPLPYDKKSECANLWLKGDVHSVLEVLNHGI